MSRMTARALLLMAGLLASTNAWGASATSTTLSSNPNPSAAERTVTLRATVAGFGSGAPTGTVTFKDGTTALGSSAIKTIGVGKPIGAGVAHACALTNTGGAKCWGWNDYGQLGDGTNTEHHAPVDVIGLGSGLTAIAVGRVHTCALTTGGGVKCWGSNFYGTLGDGTTTDSNTPVDVVGLSSGVIAIAAGGNYTCVVTNSGGAKCWGKNDYGQLGDGSRSNRSAPTDVVGLTSGVAGIAVSTAQGAHTCALTKATETMLEGGVKCWGYGLAGQLGNGAAAHSNVPVDVTGLETGVAAIAAGQNHSCALTDAGAIKCWGANDEGQLGDNSTTPRATPVDVSGLGSGMAAITAGDEHTCALTDTGGAKCWGYNVVGQLGINTFDLNRLTPTDVFGLGSGVAAITADERVTCALTTAGAGKCWGYNDHGQLGSEPNGFQREQAPADITNFGASAALIFGRATLATDDLPAGNRALRATYGGDAGHNPSTSGPLAHRVLSRATTHTALSTSTNPSTYGQTVTFTATVTTVYGPASGKVDFMDGGTLLATRVLAGGVATLDRSLPAGPHSITATMQLSPQFAASTSAPISQVVNKAATATALTARPVTIRPGASVTLTARVQGQAPAGPTGTVTFFANGDIELGTVGLTSGQATLVTDALPAGQVSLSAVFNGSASYNTSTGVASVNVTALTGAQLKVNQDSAATAEKRAPAIAALSGGGFVITWEQQTSNAGFDIRARRYLANGQPAAPEFVVNTGARTNDQLQSAVAGLSGGGFVVLWISDDAQSHVFGQRFDAAGVRTGGIFQVSADPVFWYDQLQRIGVSGTGDGGFVAVWAAGYNTDLYLRRYDGAGAPVGDPFVVKNTSATLEYDPSVSAYADGGFVVAWTLDRGGTGGIQAQRYRADDTKRLGEISIDIPDGLGTPRPSVATFANGRFILVWKQYVSGESVNEIHGQLFNGNSTPRGGRFIVNSTAAGEQSRPSVAVLPDGGFVVVWQSDDQDGDAGGIYAQVYESDGTRVDGEFRVNATTAGDQTRPQVAGMPDGKFVATWASQSGGQFAINAQRMQVLRVGD